MGSDAEPLHLLARGLRDHSMAAKLKRVQSADSIASIGVRIEHPGTFSKTVSTQHHPKCRIWAVLRQIELNSVGARICERADHYQWSKAVFHVGQESARRSEHGPWSES